ncbi:DUF4350 domain-containing protein [Bernardetia sp.]|uniref:DUF4350 domain-containing protein n=1 Tax=Bernardetia sp. TaxID=1937974 RepID=UPI0025C4F370|nr:DUF4350 domain-containing protein [Bernardetia sp.]
MEKRTFTNILITVLILSLIPITFFVYVYMKSNHVEWSERYEIENKDPYNNYMILNLLKDYSPDNDFVVIDKLLTETLSEEEIDKKNIPTSYVFIGRSPFLLDDEVDLLLKFVEKGNTAFFAAKSIPDTLSIRLNLEEQNYKQDYFYVYDSIISTNFIHSPLKKENDFTFNYRIRNDSEKTYWNYFDDYNMEENSKSIERLGFLYEKTTEQHSNYDTHQYEENDYESDEQEIYTNFIRVKYGKGYFYFHKNPVLFTNYYLIQADGKKYTERALSYLPEGNILWDERSHDYKRGKQKYQKQSRRESPISYILSLESFAWAYYLLLVSAVLFIIFRGKRMQRIIPILRKEENTTLEFTKTVGQLYYLQQDHKRLVQLKIRLFFDFIRTHYHLNTQHIDEDFRKKLSERSDISREFIDLLLSDIQKVNGQHEVSEWLLRKIHTQIQEFYTNCK